MEAFFQYFKKFIKDGYYSPHSIGRMILIKKKI